jgi:hypothetical protein
VWVYVGRHAQESALFLARLPRKGVEQLDLVEVVDDEAAHAVGESGGDLVRAFVVAVEVCALEGEARAFCNSDLTGGHDIQSEALFGDECCYCEAHV